MRSELQKRLAFLEAGTADDLARRIACARSAADVSTPDLCGYLARFPIQELQGCLPPGNFAELLEEIRQHVPTYGGAHVS